jgi:hypothetical protein
MLVGPGQANVGLLDPMRTVDAVRPIDTHL